MTGKLILIVEDELPIRIMIRYALEKAGFEAQEATDAKEAKVLMVEKTPDLILLDWMLPKTSGIDFVRYLKKYTVTQTIPIIMLTAKAEEEHKVMSLNSGVDDYIVKPFSPRELVARVHAVLRRGNTGKHNELLTVKALMLDIKNQHCTIEGEPVSLRPIEFRLLSFFLKHPDRVYTRNELLSSVWGEQAYIDERTVDVHIRRLRNCLMKNNYHTLIQTVHGTGYRFSEKKYDAH